MSRCLIKGRGFLDYFSFKNQRMFLFSRELTLQGKAATGHPEVKAAGIGVQGKQELGLCVVLMVTAREFARFGTLLSG